VGFQGEQAYPIDAITADGTPILYCQTNLTVLASKFEGEGFASLEQASIRLISILHFYCTHIQVQTIVGDDLVKRSPKSDRNCGEHVVHIRKEKYFNYYMY
jgi:hypothetical protein